MKTKHEVLEEHLKEWLITKPYSKERRTLTKQLAKTLKIHPRSVGRAMKRRQLCDQTIPERRGRPVLYTKEVGSALYIIWEAMDYPCAEILAPMIDTYVSAFVEERNWNYSNTTEALLKGMSESTLKRRISHWRQKKGLTRGYSSTTPSPLKDMIPIRKSHTWQNLPVGHTQTDTVVHCGDLLTSDVIYSVGEVDYRSYWSEYIAQWNKGEIATQESLATIVSRFPFVIHELHPDTGNEFINYHVKRWADSQSIVMTRSEPYKKNDNMCIEERNNTIPRRHVGYARLDNQSLVPIVSDILKLACLVHNHFRPVRRMIDKKRIGAKWHRTFESVAKTPYLRIIDNVDVSSSVKRKLTQEHNTLNPLQLKRELDKLKEKLTKLLDKH